VDYLIRKVCKEYELWIIELGVASDHVHLFVESPPKYSPAEIMNFPKSITAREIFKKFPILQEHFWAGEFWGDGYYVGTSGDQVTTDSVNQP
jgi:putative transposase